MTATEGASPTLRILHLEDSGPDAELIRAELTAHWPDCRIEVVSTRADFLGAIDREDFDLILSDYSIPGFDGMAALDEARRRHPVTPFIFVSGTIGEDNAVEALKRGATDYVIKDRMDRLVPVLRRALVELRETRLREEAEKRLRVQAAILDQARDAIYVRDTEDRVLFWNSSAERIFGYGFAEVRERPVPEAVYQFWGRERYLEANRILMADGEWSGEVQIVNKSGEPVDLMARWTLVQIGPDEPRRILCINTDITAQKRFETQFLRAQRLESVGLLAGGIAHDLNNVLAPILMSVNLLQQQFSDPDSLRMLGVLESSAQHGAALIRQVLAFARGEDGERAELDLRIAIRDVMRLLAETLPRAIELRTELPADLWLVSSDSTQFGQVLMNLCVNARDAMPRGGTLTVRAANVSVDEAMAAANSGARPGPHVAVAVADTGSGIPPEAIDRIFDPFFTTKAAGKGTGLGLSTVIGIVRSHGGFLKVRSDVGRGTEFVLYFPAFPAAARPAPAQTDAPPPRGNGETILVIDDEDSVREVAGKLLEASGYRVLPAADGAAGIRIFRERSGDIDAVITDMMMPGMQGPEVVASLRSIDDDVRIVAVTGVLGESMKLAEQPGRLKFLAKPMRGNELVRALQGVLARPRGR
jgi:PAS domain S-box-containing protein